MAWRVAHSIPVLFGQLRPLAPGTDPRSWGTKGDDNHSSTSDHAPKNFPGWGSQIVTAGDFPKAGQLHPWHVLDAIRRSRDERVKYAIADRQMFSSYPARGYAAWEWRPYPNAANDPHTDHGHLSLVGDPRADNTRLWVVTYTAGPPAQEEEDMQPKTALVSLKGRATVWVKEPDIPLRPLRHEWQLEVFRALGAVTVPPAPSPEAIVDTFGPLAGESYSRSVDFIRQAG
jgi:hypothetical protein